MGNAVRRRRTHRRNLFVRKIADLSSDPELLELLAAELARWAARRRSELGG